MTKDSINVAWSQDCCCHWQLVGSPAIKMSGMSINSCGKNAPFCVVLLLHHTFQGCNPNIKQVL